MSLLLLSTSLVHYALVACLKPVPGICFKIYKAKPVMIRLLVFVMNTKDVGAKMSSLCICVNLNAEE